MTNEPSWLRTYIGELSREAGLTEPTCWPIYNEFVEISQEVWDKLNSFDTSKLEPLVADPSKLEPASIRIDEMTLADYRRGVANMKTRYV